VTRAASLQLTKILPARQLLIATSLSHFPPLSYPTKDAYNPEPQPERDARNTPTLDLQLAVAPVESQHDNNQPSAELWWSTNPELPRTRAAPLQPPIYP